MGSDAKARHETEALKMPRLQRDLHIARVPREETLRFRILGGFLT